MPKLQKKIFDMYPQYVHRGYVLTRTLRGGLKMPDSDQHLLEKFGLGPNTIVEFERHLRKKFDVTPDTTILLDTVKFERELQEFLSQRSRRRGPVHVGLINDRPGPPHHPTPSRSAPRGKPAWGASIWNSRIGLGHCQAGAELTPKQRRMTDADALD